MSGPSPRPGRCLSWHSPAARREGAQDVIDKILHGTPDGRVDPSIAENLRKHLAENPGQPDRALLNHLRDQIPGFEGCSPRSCTVSGSPPDTARSRGTRGHPAWRTRGPVAVR